MRILELTVDGFRSLKKVTWKPGMLNVVIGPNGTGKSNLLRLLELVSVAARGGLSKHVQASGGMEPILWDGQAKELSIRVVMSPDDDGHDDQMDSPSYRLCLGRIGGTSSYRINHELLGDYHRIENAEEFESLRWIDRHPARSCVFDIDKGALRIIEEDVPEDETLLSLAAGPFASNPFIPRYQKNLVAWSVYHDVHVDHEAAIRSPVVTKLERRVTPDGQNLVNVLHTLYSEDRDFKNEINLAMRAAFGDEFEELIFSPAADQRIQLRVQWKHLSRQQSAADLSDGTLRFLFLLAVLASPAAAPVIAIDEPETGLHPAMLPIVAEYAVEASQRSQIILTTHSPAFLDAFKEAELMTTVAFWENGETVLRTLEGDAFQRWRQEYSMGKLLTSGELEQLAEAQT